MFRTSSLIVSLVVLVGVVAASPALAYDFRDDYPQPYGGFTGQAAQNEREREALVEQGQAQARQAEQAYRDSLRPRFDPRAFTEPVPADRYREFKPNNGSCTTTPGMGRRC